MSGRTCGRCQMFAGSCQAQEFHRNYFKIETNWSLDCCYRLCSLSIALSLSLPRYLDGKRMLVVIQTSRYHKYYIFEDKDPMVYPNLELLQCKMQSDWILLINYLTILANQSALFPTCTCDIVSRS